jgi:hypothetical protein
VSPTPRALLLVMLDIDPAIDDHEFNTWYFEEHIAERLSCPGFISARRFEAVEGSPRFLALYDLEGPEALHTAAYKSLAGSPAIGDKAVRHLGSERTMAMLAGFRHAVRNVYVEIDPQDFGVTSAGNRSPEQIEDLLDAGTGAPTAFRDELQTAGGDTGGNVDE